MSARLLVVVVLLSSSCLLAQENQPTNTYQVPDNTTSSSSPGLSFYAPLRIDRLGSMWVVRQDPVLRFQATDSPTFGQGHGPDLKVFSIEKLSNQETPTFVLPPDLLAGGEVCLKIRSYLMARDRKNSDSTHLVGYSTCQPASRYRLKTAVGSAQSELSVRH